jgi:hypothetical protein
MDFAEVVSTSFSTCASFSAFEKRVYLRHKKREKCV